MTDQEIEQKAALIIVELRSIFSVRKIDEVKAFAEFEALVAMDEKDFFGRFHEYTYTPQEIAKYYTSKLKEVPFSKKDEDEIDYYYIKNLKRKLMHAYTKFLVLPLNDN